MKDRINFIFYNQLGTEEFKNEVIVKPLRKIQQVNLKTEDVRIVALKNRRFVN